MFLPVFLRVDTFTFFLPLLGHHNAFSLVFVKEYLLDVFLFVLEDHLPCLEVPVEKLAGLGGHHMAPLLVNYCVSNDGAKSRVGKPELQLASHEIPDTWQRQKVELFYDIYIVRESLIPMQLLVTTTAICALVEILNESIVSSCLSMCFSFSKM